VLHGRKLRIAQVSSRPERAAARIASYVTDELVALGHDVTLFANEPSSARAHTTVPRVLPMHLLHADEFDLVHEHVDELRDPHVRVASLTTVHGRLDRVRGMQCDTPLVATSDAQRQSVPLAPWIAMVPTGLPLDLHCEGSGGDYLAFVGRISPDKRLDRAIAIAEATGRTLCVAARIDGDDGAYFKREIAPLMTKRCVRYLGELDETERSELLRGARGLMMPGDSLEPVAMLEAFACGTPVVAYRCAAELVDDGVTGFIADDLDDAIAAVGMLGELPRRAIREQFEARFSASAMARAYVDVYRELVAAAPLFEHELRLAAGAL
jgi:glycosyltransferase involved in cell wall biosynthesis